MRDKNRIRPFLKKFETLWVQYPDYRFGQLIYLINEELDAGDIFFPEEKEWEKAIEKFIN